MKLPPCVREWRRVAREAARAVLAAETRFGAKTEALKFRAFRAFIASVYRAKDAASARERELTRAMEVRSRAREVLAEAEMTKEARRAPEGVTRAGAAEDAARGGVGRCLARDLTRVDARLADAGGRAVARAIADADMAGVWERLEAGGGGRSRGRGRARF